MIKPSDFKDWQEYYWTYQNLLAKNYLIPMLAKQGHTIEDKKIFEIGCGSGGVIEAFAEKSRRAVGVELMKLDYSRFGSSRVEYITADIYDQSHRDRYKDVYDIILFRDVIEHLPKKKETLDLCDQLLSDDGIIFMSFPPYYSPFGAHQQVFSRNFFARLPYVHLMPGAWYLKLVRWLEMDNDQAIKIAEEIVETKTTISGLYKAIRHSAFEISDVHYYLIRPSFEIRYGKKPRKIQWMKYLPGLREVLVMGVYMTLRKKRKS